MNFLLYLIIPCCLFLISACSVTTITDKNGNVTKTTSFHLPSSQKEKNSLPMPEFAPIGFQKNKIPSKNIFYFSGFANEKPQLSTRDNIVAGEIDKTGPIEIDFSLTTNLNERKNKQYLLALQFETSTFSHKLSKSDKLTLSCDSGEISLKPSDISDVTKTSSFTQTIDGATEYKEKINYFTSLDFYLEKSTLEQILDAKKVTATLVLKDSTLITAELTPTNLAILKEFSTFYQDLKE